MPDGLGVTGEAVGELATELNEASLGAASSCMESNPSMADLMSAITSLNQNVTTKLTAISDTMDAMQATLAIVTGKVRDLEEAVNEHDSKLTSLETLCKNLQDGLNEQRKKLADLESRSRRQNVRIIGIPEGAEKGKPVEFITKLISALLGTHKSDDDCGPSTPLSGSEVGGRSSPTAVHRQTPLLPDPGAHPQNRRTEISATIQWVEAFHLPGPDSGGS